MGNFIGTNLPLDCGRILEGGGAEDMVLDAQQS